MKRNGANGRFEYENWGRSCAWEPRPNEHNVTAGRFGKNPITANWPDAPRPPIMKQSHSIAFLFLLSPREELQVVAARSNSPMSAARGALNPRRCRRGVAPDDADHLRVKRTAATVFTWSEICRRCRWWLNSWPTAWGTPLLRLHHVGAAGSETASQCTWRSPDGNGQFRRLSHYRNYMVGPSRRNPFMGTWWKRSRPGNDIAMRGSCSHDAGRISTTYSNCKLAHVTYTNSSNLC